MLAHVSMTLKSKLNKNLLADLHFFQNIANAFPYKSKGRVDNVGVHTESYKIRLQFLKL